MIQQQCPTPIQTALSLEGENKILGAKVDGYDEQTQTIYQYHGCYFHGCQVCFKNGTTFNRQAGKTMKDLHEATRRRTRKLRQAGYHVVEKWGHEWNEERVQHELPEKLSSLRPICPRDALFGGRTNAIQLYASCDDSSTHRIRYIDVVSLYPTVMWEEEYPLGHPTLYFGRDPILQCHDKVIHGEWFGLVKCDVDPPRGLYFPVLPLHINGKMMFTLCYQCAVNEHQDECLHDRKDRRLCNGVWTTCELQEACRQGYEIHKIHEVWHYPQRSNTLFRDYIRENLKLKLEASGWPEYCTTDDKKREFVEQVEQAQGIQLDPDKVKKNAGLRTCAKLLLNTLWGKFAQSPFKAKTLYISDPQEYFKILHDDTLSVVKVLLLNDSLVQVRYETAHEATEDNVNGNVVLASFVTAWARLRLYKVLSRLQRRVIYHDTDSCVYKSAPGEDEIEIGDRLGCWSDECGDPETNWIDEFVALGPKSYAYQTKKGEQVVKCKGISLNPQTKQLVHFQSMLELMVGIHEEDKIRVEYPRKIQRDVVKRQLKTVPLTKELRLVYNKRRRLEDGIHTLPYGY